MYTSIFAGHDLSHVSRRTAISETPERASFTQLHTMYGLGTIVTVPRLNLEDAPSLKRQ